jgi:hypothetical protein
MGAIGGASLAIAIERTIFAPHPEEVYRSQQPASSQEMDIAERSRQSEAIVEDVIAGRLEWDDAVKRYCELRGNIQALMHQFNTNDEIEACDKCLRLRIERMKQQPPKK